MIYSKQLCEYVILCACLCLGVLSTALASPLYYIYENTWNISATEIGYVFVTYMVGVVSTLIFLGNVTSKFGYKKIIIIGLLISIISLILSALSKDIWTLCFSRFLIGISSGLLSTSAIIGLKDKFPFKQKDISEKVSSIIYVTGFGLGPLLGGIIADHSNKPLVTPYILIATISTIVLISSFLINSEHHSSIKNISTKTKIINYPKISKELFLLCSISALCCFGIFSIYAAFSGTFLTNLPFKQSATSTGILISSILFISAFVQIISKSLSEKRSFYYGFLLLGSGMLIFTICNIYQYFTLLIIAIITIGIGHGLSLGPSYYFIGKVAECNDSSIYSTFLLIAYQGSILPILLLSLLIDKYGVLISLILISSILILTLCWLSTQIKYLTK
ncbi:multidrug resistance protein [compost metagenome]